MKRSGAVLLLFAMLLAGCWDSEDIEDRGNVLAIAIDEADSDQEEDNIAHLEDPPNTEMIRLTVQVAVPGEVTLGPTMGGEGGSEVEPVWVLSATGHSLEEAISNLQQEVAEQLFLGQLRVIVVSEDVAKKGLERFNESLRRNPQVRRNAWMVVSQEDAASYMDIAPQLEAVPTLYLSNMVENAVNAGTFPEDYIGFFWRMVSSKGQDGFLPYLKIKSDENIQINGLAYFKGDQMIGSTEPLDIGTFMGIIGFRQGGYRFFDSVPGTDAHVLTEPIQRRTNIHTEMKAGELRIRVNMRYEFVITEKTSDDVDLSDPQVIKSIEKHGRQTLIENAEQFITQMQEEQSDIFGFGEYVRAKHPGYWNRKIGTQKKWHDEFQDLDVEVDARFNVRRVETQAR